MANSENWAHQQIRDQNMTINQKKKYARLTEKSMAPHRPQHSSLSEVGKSEYDRNVAFLSIFILLYLYGSDDGIISSKEKKVFRKVFNKNKKLLSRDNYEELLKHTEKTLHSQDVLDYIENKKYPNELVKNAVNLIKKYALKDYAYNKTLNELLEQNKNSIYN
jgi:hypothetical protein